MLGFNSCFSGFRKSTVDVGMFLVHVYKFIFTAWPSAEKYLMGNMKAPSAMYSGWKFQSFLTSWVFWQNVVVNNKSNLAFMSRAYGLIVTL